MIKDNFGNWTAPGKGAAIPDFGAPDPKAPATRVFVEPGVPVSLTMAWLRPWTPHADTIVYNQDKLTDMLALQIVSRRLEQAAQTLGASPLRRFLSISLPLSLPGIFAGAMLGFARSIGEFGATITFVSDIPGETRTLPIAIYAALQVPGAEAAVSRFAIISVLLSLGALLISELLARRATQGRMPHVL